jgi:hypothetical protein
MRRLLAAFCVLGLTTAMALAADESKDDSKDKKDVTKKNTARVSGLNISKIEKGDPGMFFGATASTNVAVVLTLPGRSIIGVDTNASKLTSFTDDKKTDLSKPKTPSFFKQPWLSFYNQLSNDKQRCTVHLVSMNAPAAGATKILVKASVAVLCGSDEKKAEKKDVAVKDGTKEKVGPAELEVKSPFPGAKNLSLIFLTDKPVIKTVEFFDADGKAVKANPGFAFTPPGSKKHQTAYNLLDPKVTKVTVKLTYFEKTEEVKVPLNLNFGLGF